MKQDRKCSIIVIVIVRVIVRMRSAMFVTNGVCSVILVIPLIVCKSLLRYHIFGDEVESFLL